MQILGFSLPSISFLQQKPKKNVATELFQNSREPQITPTKCKKVTKCPKPCAPIPRPTDSSY